MNIHGTLIRKFGHPLAKWWSGDRDTYRYLREFRDSQFWSIERIRELQSSRLEAILKHAYNNSPYYRRRFGELGATPGDFRELQDLSKFPLLEKSDIQENRDAIVASSWPREDLIKNQTGGSTGAPISFFLSRDRSCSRAAATIRHDEMAGMRIGDKCAAVWGAVQDQPQLTWKTRLRSTLIKRERRLDSGHLTEEKMTAFANELARFRPDTILAYARSLALLTEFWRSREMRPCHPGTIIATAEVLEPEHRALIEGYFGCPVFNRYGSREFSVIASECSEHCGMHIMAEGLLVEIVNGKELAGPGETGSIVITDLLNYAMPMIRYRIGDVGRLSQRVCACGRGLPLLEEVSGRVTDFLVTRDGTLVSGVFLATYVVANRPSLGQVQIYQQRPGSVCYRIRPSSSFDPDADMSYLVQRTRKFLGNDCEVTWETVQDFPVMPSGKFRFSLSEVTPSFLTGSANRTSFQEHTGMEP